MFQFGIHKEEAFEAIGAERRTLGARIAYNLVDVGESTSEKAQRRFEDICFTMRFSNGTFRTSFRNRFPDLNQRMMTLLAESFAADTALRVEDRAVSHALTAYEWALLVLDAFPKAVFEASDLVLHLVELKLPDGTVVIAEPDGTPLQGIKRPFVVSLAHREPRRYPVNHLVAALMRRKIASFALPAGWTDRDEVNGMAVRQLPLIHPLARDLARRDSRFRVVRRSVFDVSDEKCHGLRTMNILNQSYFSEKQLMDGVESAFRSVVPGGLWVCGRTTEDTFTNHASIFRRATHRWELVERLGNGSEIEDMVCQAAFA